MVTRTLSIIALTLILFTGCGFEIIEPGERGVWVAFGETLDQCIKEGLQGPYNSIKWDLHVLDIKPHSIKVDKAGAGTHDLQEVYMDLVVIYRIDGDQCHKIIKEVGADFASRIMHPAILEEAKAGTAQFTLSQMIQERPKVSERILQGLRVRLKPFYIIVDAVNITNFDASKDFMRSVERKQIVLQEVQTAENERLKAEINAKTVEINAIGEAKAIKIKQEALKQGPEVLKFKELEVLSEKWDGKFPQFVGSGGIPLLNFDMRK